MVTASSGLSFRPGQTVAASSLFSVSDQDGDTITQYKITDATAGGATLLLNGVAQAENTPITLTAAQLAQLQVQNASGAGTSTITVQAFDGQVWSNATTVNLTTTESAPVETVTGAINLVPNQTLTLSTANLPMTVSDADGDAITQYRFTDVGTGASSAHLIFNGTAVAQGGTVTVSAAQLSQVQVQGGSANGSDGIQVQVYDGYQWSNAQTVNVVTYQDHAPVVTASSNARVHPGQAIDVSSLFSVSDQDGDTITQYRITDTTIGGAYLLINGTMPSANTPVTISATNLSQLQIQGSATDSTNAFTIQAYDGQVWSNATTVNLTTTESARSRP